MPGEDTLKRGKHGLALLLERGEVAPQTTEDGRARGTAETAGDLLLDFDHAQVAFSVSLSARTCSICRPASLPAFIATV